MKHLLLVTVLALALTTGAAKADVITTVDLTVGAVSTVDTTSTGSTAFAEATVNLDLLAIASTSTNLPPVSVTPVVAAVPEPPSLALLAGGISMLGLGLAMFSRGRGRARSAS